MNTAGEGEGEMNWESSMEIYTLLYAKQTASENLLCKTGSSTQCSVMTWRGGMGRWGGREAQEGGDICILMADLPCCTEETNTTL